jgi:tetratricopeptide (TPR) repeat protein
MSGRAAVLILALYGCAVLSKEHAVVLPALFLLTDVLLFERSPQQAVRERQRLYLGLCIVAVAGLILVAAVLMSATTAGFGIEGLSPYEYFLTQCRVVFLYLQLILLPLWQNADYDLSVSRNLLDGGAWLGLLTLLAGLVVLWRLRRRYPVAVYGIALCLIWLAPTSTIIPIKDVAAERRLYVPLLGVSFVLVEVLLRHGRRTSLSVVVPMLLVAGFLTHQRAAVWGNDVAFWSDTVSKSVTKTRGYAHLMHALVRSRQCETALKTAAGFPPRAAEDADFLVSLGYAYDCLRRPEDATQAYERAAARSPGPGMYLILASAYERLGRISDAERVRGQALGLEPQTGFDRVALERYLQQNEQSRARTVESR